jgi:uncharacterized protein with PIN domain
MGRLHDFLARERKLLRQDRELHELRREVERLRDRNEHMQRAMRRCLTCDYRLAAVSE